MAGKLNLTLKAEVKAHWEAETCGTRYGHTADRKAYFDEISEARYRLEPYIAPFADFSSARGKAILEIGVGAGADFANWCPYSEHATGVDLTERAIALTTERLQLNQVPSPLYDLRTADAEQLPFAAASFDLVYSWGVLHHTPDTERLQLSQVGFDEIKVSSKLGFGDLLMVEPSAKYRSPLFKLAWRIYPRWLVRLLGDRYGLGLLIEAVKTIPSQ